MSAEFTVYKNKPIFHSTVFAEVATPEPGSFGEASLDYYNIYKLNTRTHI
jgi:hypothetical protein